MKNMTNLTIFLSLTLFLSFVSLTKLRKNEVTPQAQDLKNHFGEDKVGSKFGPQDRERYVQFVEANPDTFIPSAEGKNNIEKELKGQKNLAGGMTNVAPSAQKIVTPEIAVPKLNVHAEVIHPAVVQVPTYKGMKKEYLPVTALDKQTGAIIEDKVLVSRPVYELEEHVMDIKHVQESSINLTTGERIEKKDEKVNHALEEKKL